MPSSISTSVVVLAFPDTRQRLGEVKLKGIAVKQTLYQLADEFLSSRVFANDYGQSAEAATVLDKAANGKQICSNCSRPLVCKYCGGGKSGLKGNRVGSIMPREASIFERISSTMSNSLRK